MTAMDVAAEPISALFARRLVVVSRGAGDGAPIPREQADDASAFGPREVYSLLLQQWPERYWMWVALLRQSCFDRWRYLDGPSPQPIWRFDDPVERFFICCLRRNIRVPFLRWADWSTSAVR